MFRKVLIANRGEIACRVMRTCRRLGIATVAVYSDADAHSLHVRTADEAVHIGPSPAQESYLNIDRILSASQRTGAQAIHPGYGFLSENEDFAEACEQAGITFIGPPATAIRAMGSKAAAKALMQQAQVPLTPGYHGDQQAPEFLQQQADAIGYPVLIKASAGGGGKGMRRVEAPEDFAAALASCKREAASSFGDDRVLIERYILEPRHIEIQVFGDTHGNVVSLFERDCSVQRRHQKVLEEAPAPGMTAERRAAMSNAACEAARAVGYVSAGTVEFIADPQGNFYFMEMNTRLQVEHPVTEYITGLDLVEWQLRVAAGEPLPLAQDQLRISGHALEARVYAEDPANNFLPSTGKLLHVRQPAGSRHVRVDAGVARGDTISAFYDPMIAKLIVWDQTREGALERMQQALGQFQVVGVKTNLQFLHQLVTSRSFTEARLDTALIERESAWLLQEPHREDDRGTLLAALATLLREAANAGVGTSPWALHDGWRSNGTLQRTLRFAHEGATQHIEVTYLQQGFRLRFASTDLAANGTLQHDGTLEATLGDIQVKATAIEALGMWHVFHAGRHWQGAILDPLAAREASDIRQSSLLSPMPGVVTALLAVPGAHVVAGTPLIVLEAMKMEYTIKAPADGTVQSFLFAVRDQVPEATQLLVFEPDNAAGKPE